MKVKGLLIDVEGTIVGDKRYLPIPGAVEFIREVRTRGLPLRLITNNTTDSREALREKLNHAGFDFSLEETHTCIRAAVKHLRAGRMKRCLVLGLVGLKEMFTEEGFAVVDESEVDAVIVGLDTGLTYDRLALACDAVTRHGAAPAAPGRRSRRLPSTGTHPESRVGASCCRVWCG